MTTRREFLGQAGMGLAAATLLPTARAFGATLQVERLVRCARVAPAAERVAQELASL